MGTYGASLAAAQELTRTFQVTGVGATLNGRNGGGDRYYTDGELTIGVISPGGVGYDINFHVPKSVSVSSPRATAFSIAPS